MSSGHDVAFSRLVEPLQPGSPIRKGPLLSSNAVGFGAVCFAFVCAGLSALHVATRGSHLPGTHRQQTITLALPQIPAQELYDPMTVGSLPLGLRPSLEPVCVAPAANETESFEGC